MGERVSIVVNLRLFTKGEIGGLENYVRHVVGGLSRAHAGRGTPITVLARPSEVPHVQAIAPDATVLPVSTELEVDAEVRRGAYTFLFCPLLVLEPLHPAIPSAVMIPDVQHEFFPEFFDAATLRWRTRTYATSARNADVVFTLSEHAKKTIVDAYGVPPGKVEVIYLAVDPEFERPAPPEAVAAFEALKLPTDYVYFPANYWPHKNHETLIRAMQRLVRRRPDVVLACTGAPGSGADRVQALVRTLGVDRNVRLLGYQDRATVAELYRHARALVFPSRFEGFGIPILEAFHARVPIVTSRFGSCQEVAGDAAVIVDELDPESIAAGIEQVLDAPDRSAAMVARGVTQARQFSWARAVDLSVRAIDRAAAAPPSLADRIEIAERPLVSIVTPTYNMAGFLRHTIDSVLGQDYPHIEYLVMDAASSDDTVQLLRQYEGRLSFVSERDKGQADAVNKGFHRTRGAIFAFLNADDTYLPGAVGTAVRRMTESPSVGVLYGEAYYIDEAGNQLERYPTMAFDANLLKRNCFICQPSTFMRREVYGAVDGMDISLHWALDYDLWIRISKIAPMLKVDEYLATSRLHRNNKTLGQRGKIYKQIMQVARTHYGYVPLDWILGYASYLVEPQQGAEFESSRPSRVKSAVAFAAGAWENRRSFKPFWAEWSGYAGLASQEFTGRWADGWVSRRHRAEYAIPRDCTRIRIEGRHLLPFDDGFELEVRSGRTTLHRQHVRVHGTFVIDLECPRGWRGSTRTLEFRSSNIYQPIQNGDHRQLSWLLDTVTFASVEPQPA